MEAMIVDLERLDVFEVEKGVRILGVKNRSGVMTYGPYPDDYE